MKPLGVAQQTNNDKGFNMKKATYLQLEWPVWVLRSCDGAYSTCRFGESDREYFSVFTNRRAAKRFARANGIEQPVLEKLGTTKEFVNFFHELVTMPYGVHFDPSPLDLGERNDGRILVVLSELLDGLQP